MKKILFSLVAALMLAGCGSSTSTVAKKNNVVVHLDLVNITEDKVAVHVTPPTLTETEIVYHLPKIIPGTYSVDDYGKMVEQFKAYDAQGKELPVQALSTNSWQIKEAQKLAKITYLVNDTFDSERGGGFGGGIFSPAGTNINAGKNFMINQHGFVGYFEGKKDINYELKITHPDSMFGATSLLDTDASATSDVFLAERYNELVDNPIMYGKPDFTAFQVDGMDILFSVYSPNAKHSAAVLSPAIEKMIRAQKKFLGPVNNNKKYTILLYLSETDKPDARGFGALEHNTSTTVVFPEMMPAEALGKQLIDVVSHEFFHIVTPLGVHSHEIHYFDFNNPKMSQHLWMYEGVTEYFANLFQVNQGLISEEDFYKRMANKISEAKRMNDTMPFTEMSQNVLTEPYKSQYLNVYSKGALIGMCIDIIIREKSNGTRGILDLMQKLTEKYGPSRPFLDAELFDEVTAMTYPEVGTFLRTHVSGSTPIDYASYFAKMGVGKGKIQKPENVLFLKRTPCITANSNKEIVVRNDTELSPFMQGIGLKADDIITGIDGKSYTMDAIGPLMDAVQKWKENDSVTLTVTRGGKPLTLHGKVVFSYVENEGYITLDPSKNQLKTSWLKG